MIRNDGVRRWSVAMLAVTITAGIPSTLWAGASRAKRGLTLKVPAQHAKLGTVYYVHPGHDAQVTFTSDAPLEHIKGTTNQVVGYMVTAGSPTSDDFQIKAAEFHLPVKSFDTGIPMRNQHLQSGRWLNAKKYHDIVFTLSGTRNTQTVKSTDGFTTLSLDLVGKMTVKKATKEMVIPARITVMPKSSKTAFRAPGDLAAIRCAYTLKMADFGVGTGDPALKSGKLSDELQMETFLLLSTVSPDKS